MTLSLRKLFEALKTISPSSIKTERTFSVTGFYNYDGLFKFSFLKEEQEEKDRIEKERLERIELLDQQARAKNLDKTFC